MATATTLGLTQAASHGRCQSCEISGLGVLTKDLEKIKASVASTAAPVSRSVRLIKGVVFRKGKV